MNTNKKTTQFLFDNMRDGAILLNEKGEIIDINEHAQKLFEHEITAKTSLIGKRLTAIFHHRNNGQIKNAFINNLKNRTEDDVDIHLKLHNSMELDLRFSFRPIEIGDRRLTFVLLKDRSAEYRINELIDSHETNYYDIINNSHNAILIIHKSGAITDFNDAYLKLSGYTSKELLNMTYLDLLVNASKYTKDAFVLPTGKVYQEPHKTKTNQIIHIKTNVIPCKKSSWYIFVDTITKQIEFNNTIQKWRVQMENILAGLSNKEGVGVLVTSKLTGFTFANDYICEKFGYTNEEMLKKKFLHHLMDWSEQEENIDNSMAIISGAMKSALMKARFYTKDDYIITADVDLSTHGDFILSEITNIVETGEKIENKEENITAKIAAEYSEPQKGLLILSVKDGITYANKEAYEAFGYAKNEMNGINAASYITHPDYVKELNIKSIAVFTGIKSKAEFPIRFLAKDGKPFKAYLSLKKHKEGKAKYFIMQFENVQRETA